MAKKAYQNNPKVLGLDVSTKTIGWALFDIQSRELLELTHISPIPKPKDWKQHFLKPMMTNIQEIEPLESLDPINELTGLLQDWTTNRQAARTMDDIFNKLPYTEDGFTYFRMEDFFNFCKRNHWEKDKTQTGNLLKQLDVFVEEERVRVKKQQPRLIKIKTMKQVEASTSKLPYQEDHF